MGLNKLIDRRGQRGQARVVDVGTVGHQIVAPHITLKNYILRSLPNIHIGDIIKVVVLGKISSETTERKIIGAIFDRREVQNKSESRARKEIVDMVFHTKSPDYFGTDAEKDVSDAAEKLVAGIRARAKIRAKRQKQSDEGPDVTFVRRQSLPINMQRRKSPTL